MLNLAAPQGGQEILKEIPFAAQDQAGEIPLRHIVFIGLSEDCVKARA
jgi:hypothetical protein